MATRRTNATGTEQKSDETEKSSSSKQQQKRVLRKPKNLNDSSTHLQWIILILVFSLAILGLIYYYNYYQPQVTTLTQSNPKQHGSSIKASKTTTKVKSTVKNEPKNTKKPPAPSNKVTSKESKNKPQTDPAAKSEEGIPADLPQYPPEKLENLVVFPKNLRERLLRLPIPPSDADRPLILEIISADDFLIKKDYSKALEKFNELLKRLPQSPRSLYGKAIALEHIAEKRNNVKVLDSAIEHYRKVSIDSFLAPAIIKEACLIQLVTLLDKRERYDEAITACERLYKIDPDNDGYAIQLGLIYIKANRMTAAKEQLKNVINKWPDNLLAKANLGYVYYLEGDCSSAIPLLRAGMDEDSGIRRNARFYRYTGDCLVKLNMYNESLDLYKVAVDLELFPSLWQRSLTNVQGLRAQPWWAINDTGIEQELLRIVNEIDTIKSELLPLVTDDQQSVVMLYTNGIMNEDTCHVTPQSCDLVSNITTLTQCTNGETKVLLLPSSLHIPPSVGITNTRLRAIIPVSLTGSLTLRVADQTRELQEGVLSVIDDSFEQELWHHSTSSSTSSSSTSGDKNSLILIIEFCHPDYIIKRTAIHN